jgi:hypothetical protein
MISEGIHARHVSDAPVRVPAAASVLGPGRMLAKDERYRQVRAWYARDAGRTILEEVVATLERAATTVLGGVTGP